MNLKNLLKKGMAVGLAVALAIGCVPAIDKGVVTKAEAAEFNINYYSGLSGTTVTAFPTPGVNAPATTSGGNIILSDITVLPQSSYTFYGWDVYNGTTKTASLQRSGTGYLVNGAGTLVNTYQVAYAPVLVARWEVRGSESSKPTSNNYSRKYLEADYNDDRGTIAKDDTFEVSVYMGEKIDDKVRSAIEELFNAEKSTHTYEGYSCKIALSETGNLKIDSYSGSTDTTTLTLKATSTGSPNPRIVVTCEPSGYNYANPGSNNTPKDNIYYTYESYNIGKVKITKDGSSSSSSSSSKSGSSSSGGSTTTSSKKNSDGSTTTTVTNKNGTTTKVTATTKKADGSTEVVTTETNSSTGAKSVTTTTTKSDGSSVSVKTDTAKDGSKSVTETKTTAAGKKTAVSSSYSSSGDVTSVSQTVTNASGSTTKSVSYGVSGSDLSVSSISVSGTSLRIPETVTANGVEYSVTSIGSGAVRGNSQLKKVTIGDNIKSIGDNAFSGMSSLKTIVIERKLTKIGTSAFNGINSKATFKIEADKAGYKATKKAIKKAGVPKSVKYKRVS